MIVMLLKWLCFLHIHKLLTHFTPKAPHHETTYSKDHYSHGSHKSSYAAAGSSLHKYQVKWSLFVINTLKNKQNAELQRAMTNVMG